MSSRLNPYLAFDGNAREAMEFYRSVFGGELTVNTFDEFGNSDPAVAGKIMHAQLETPEGYTLMASDTPPGMELQPGSTITVCLSGTTDGPLREYWEKLSDGATVSVPLEKQMWGDEFGQLTDRYGVAWMVNIGQPQE